MAIVSATGGGAAGPGDQAGISVVGSPSPLPASAGGGATMVAATSDPFVIGLCHGGAGGAAGGGGGGGGGGAAGGGDAWAPAARSASVDSGTAGA